MLFIDAQEAFITNIIYREMSQETIKGYLKDLQRFNRYMMDVYNTTIYVEDVTSDDIENYMYYLRNERKLAPRSRNRYLNSLRSFLNYAVKKRWVEYNVATDIEQVKIIDEKKTALTQEEIEILLQELKHPIINFAVALMSYTGMRVTEAQTLELKDINFEENQLLANGKGSKQRLIPIASSLKPYLDNYLNNIRVSSAESQFVLATKKTGSLSPVYINHELHKATKALGWDKTVTCHTLRRSFATNLLRKNVNIYAISELLGHASLKTTTVYLQLNDDELQTAVDKL